MTLDELRDWHANRAGWTQVESDFEGELMWSKGPHKQWDHPFPATIDGAASAMPNGLRFSRDARDNWRVRIEDEIFEVPDTGNEIYDRYLLAKLAWEAEAAQ